jgi:hypothetical protein
MPCGVRSAQSHAVGPGGVGQPEESPARRQEPVQPFGKIRHVEAGHVIDEIGPDPDLRRNVEKLRTDRQGEMPSAQKWLGDGGCRARIHRDVGVIFRLEVWNVAEPKEHRKDSDCHGDPEIG